MYLPAPCSALPAATQALARAASPNPVHRIKSRTHAQACRVPSGSVCTALTWSSAGSPHCALSKSSGVTPSSVDSAPESSSWQPVCHMPVSSCTNRLRPWLCTPSAVSNTCDLLRSICVQGPAWELQVCRGLHIFKLLSAPHRVRSADEVLLTASCSRLLACNELRQRGTRPVLAKSDTTSLSSSSRLVLSEAGLLMYP